MGNHTEQSSKLSIVKIIFENFKSYSGAVEIPTLHPSFTAVVGANGSGKSNLLDGLLFVFGKRTKQIRLNKLSELIHNSGKEGVTASAKVTVYLKTQDSAETVSIAREAFATNVSKYSINEKQVKFAELSNFLAEKGLNVFNNRFIILQGEVDSISCMKPKGEKESEEGLLEYLEELIGSNQFIQEISEKEKVMEKNLEERLVKEKRTGALQKELENLLPNKEKSSEGLRKKTELSTLELKLFIRKTESIEKRLKEKETEQLKLEDKTKDSTEKEKRLVEKKNSVAKEAKEEEKEVTALKIVSTKLGVQLEELQKEDFKLEEAMKYAKKSYKENKAKAGEKLKEVEKLTKENDELVLKKEKALQSLKETESAANRYSEILTKIETNKAPVLSSICEKLEFNQREYKPFRDKIKFIGEEIVEKKNIKTENEEELKKLESKHKELKTKTETVTNQHSSAEKELQMAEQELANTKTANRNKVTEKNKTEAELQELEKTRKKLVTEVRAFEENQTRVQSNDRVEKALFAFVKKEGLQKSFFGKLGQLGRVDNEYDVAASSASSAWKNYLVDSTATAQRLIGFLRKEKVGRATFLVLEKQKKLFGQMHAAFLPPEGALRLFDLIEVSEDRFRTAFYFAVKNTLVARDIESASKVAFGRKDGKVWRTVTKKGEVIEQSGTMTGGSSQTKKGLLCVKENQKEKMQMFDFHQLEKVKQQLSSLDRILEQKKKTNETITCGLSEARNVIREKEAIFRKANEKVELAKLELQNLENYKKEINTIEEKIAYLRSENRTIDKDQNKLKTEKEKNEREGNKFKNEIELLERKKAEICGKEYSESKQLLKETNTKMEEAKTILKETAAQIENLPALLEKRKNEAKDPETLAANAIEKGKEINFCKQKIDAQANELAVTTEKIEEQMRTKQKKLTTLKKQLRESEENLENFRNSLEDYEVRAKELSSEIAALERTRDGTLHRIKELEEKQKELVKLCCSLKITCDSFDGFDQHALEEKLQLYKEEGVPSFNITVLEEFVAKQIEVVQKEKELQNCRDRTAIAKSEFELVRQKRFSRFMEGFVLIAEKLKEIYRTLTLGGDAELELVDSLDPFSEGVQLSIRPPKKSWKTVQNLSGGEKTLSSLALIFALHAFKPAPIYIMDEIDAALDFKNVSIVGSFVRKVANEAQFIVISLRNNMFELADRLVGVYKINNESKVLALDHLTK